MVLSEIINDIGSFVYVNKEQNRKFVRFHVNETKICNIKNRGNHAMFYVSDHTLSDSSDCTNADLLSFRSKKAHSCVILLLQLS